MANIKFSQFTVGNTESDIDFVVGYKGGDNIQISPANLLSATLTGYLPLTGGTMTGNIRLNDNVNIGMGNSGDYAQFHDGTNTYLSNGTGDFYIRNQANDKDIIFQSDDGSGGNTTYFKVDGGAEVVVASKEFRFLDNVPVKLGTGPDFQMLHNGTSTSIENSTGNLLITNFADDSDIIFKSDNGSGGTTEYFRLDGSIVRNVFSKNVGLEDNVQLIIGSGNDLKILHDGSDSVIQNDTGDLEIQNRQDDGDIVFKSDDGIGGVTTYFSIDGGAQLNRFAKNVMWNDNIVAYFGGGFDLQISHDGTDSYIQNATGNLKIFQNANDKDITFYNDDGSGGTTAYFFLDGSAASGGYKYTVFPDQSTLSFGNSLDFNIFHFSNTFVNNETGDLYITNSANDKDVIFRSDDGAGGVTTYFRVDGGDENVRFSKDAKFSDSVKAVFGGSNDLQVYHDGSNSYVQAEGTGDLVIEQKTDDKDILFKSDDGSGGVTTYFYLDGSLTLNRFLKSTLYNDNIRASFGASSDLQIYHDGTHSYLSNNTGNLYIQQLTDDSDIVFQSDDGAGGVTTYMFLDGSTTLVQFYKSTKHSDNIKANFGNSNDLEIYHSGSHGFINGSNGAGSLYLRPGTGGTIQLETNSGVDMISTNATDVRMYSGGNERLRVKNIGINIQNVPTYADNTAAIAGGLTTGDVYRTGDLLKIVH